MTTFRRQVPTTTLTSTLCRPLLRSRKAYLPWCIFFMLYAFLTRRLFGHVYIMHSPSAHPTPSCPGVFLLGMHRSSTSVLSGLLVQGFGYEVGGPSLPPAEDNPKGFFERSDVVDMNNAFLNTQGMTWDNHDKIGGYNLSLTNSHLSSGVISNATLGDIVNFYNRAGRTVPYLHKDPRTCLTLPVWMEHLSHRPAILFTYRHPLEVAMSLKKRDNFPLVKGFKLWIIYNVLAVRYSSGYCRVVTSSDAIVHDTLEEMARILTDLSKRCHVIPPPNVTLSSTIVDAFVDHSLQHNTNGKHQEEEQLSNATILQDFGNGCVAPKIKSDHAEGSRDEMKETKVYLMAIKLFCAFKSGRAFWKNYEMPDLSTLNAPPSGVNKTT
ncbi:hypothetical protein HJC23_013125 [Cyclotella cryptica]|uniref:Protein-tyrosine sulfotransferase n=1 Tax=Cyclotella cryptica TaxID=29204 RepID=A0ABD3QMY6_9STRA|eukprot:CCRYP_003938-RA/>CCRYP_003938-RA protein AED:0.10 eAED:0.10 QI:0/-1/0/1/-1/1/1/0/379